MSQSVSCRRLLVRIKNIPGDNIPPIDEIIDTLQAQYGEYVRFSRQKLTGMIHKALDVVTDIMFDELRDALQPGSDSSVNLIKEDKQLWKAEEDDGSRFLNFGALDNVLEKLKMGCGSIFKGLAYVELESEKIPGWLLIGPSGCGKTKLAHAIANEAAVPFYKVSATQLLSGASPPAHIKDLFLQAIKTEPSIVFIDDLHEIGDKPEGISIVSQLKAFMDGSLTHYVKGKKLLLIGATHGPDALDPSLTRSGQFQQFSLRVGGVNNRLQILTVLTRKVKVEGSLDLHRLATATPGFIGADLRSLVDTAVRIGMRKFFSGRKLEFSNENTNTKKNRDWLREKLSDEEMEKISITMSDFLDAAKQVRPAFRLQNPTCIPDVILEDVGGLDEVKETFTSGVIVPIKYPEAFNKAQGIDWYLLYGPPGCGKTLIANAVANEAGASFIRTTGSELVSQLKVQKIFSRARECSPCILLIDNVDGIVLPRKGGEAPDQQVMLLKELEAAFEHKGVFIIGATDRPEVLDKDILERGKLLHVPLPNPDERGLILKAVARNKRLDTDVDLVAIGSSDRCANFSGADLFKLMNEAVMAAVEEKLTKIEAATSITKEGTSGSLSESFLGGMPHTIKAIHFDQGLAKISPSVSEEQKQYYHQLQERFK